MRAGGWWANRNHTVRWFSLNANVSMFISSDILSDANAECHTFVHVIVSEAFFQPPLYRILVRSTVLPLILNCTKIKQKKIAPSKWKCFFILSFFFYCRVYGARRASVGAFTDLVICFCVWIYLMIVECTTIIKTYMPISIARHISRSSYGTIIVLGWIRILQKLFESNKW